MERRRLDRGVAQLIMAPVRERCRKPTEVYGRIERLFDGPYLELFSRACPPNWDTAWSNETGKSLW